MSFDREIRTAVKWWLMALLTPKHDNGDDSEAGSYGRVLAGLNAQNHRPGDDQLRLFAQVFENLLHRDLADMQREGLVTCNLRCDYDPCGILGDAAHFAAIHRSRFPWKTNMKIRQGEVTVSHGYGAPWTTVALVE